eukprot:1186539-Prorocentrum_minimum.AAC.1
MMVVQGLRYKDGRPYYGDCRTRKRQSIAGIIIDEPFLLAVLLCVCILAGGALITSGAPTSSRRRHHAGGGVMR